MKKIPNNNYKIVNNKTKKNTGEDLFYLGCIIIQGMIISSSEIPPC